MHRTGHQVYHFFCGLALVWLLLFLEMGCARPPLRLDPGNKTYSAKDHLRQWRAWTRSARIYNNLEVRYFVGATYLSRSFRRAYVARYSKEFRLLPAERERLASQQQKQAQAAHEFLVALYTYQMSWNNLANPLERKKTWKIRMVVGQEAIAPLRIEEIEPLPPTTRVMFPQVEYFHRAYRLYFPRQDKEGKTTLPANTRQFILRFGSSLGTADLLWKLL